MNENSRFKPLITYFIWLICFLLIQSVWAWIFLKFRIGDGFDLQKRILFRMGILEVIMLIFCWMLNHFYTHEKLLRKIPFHITCVLWTWCVMLGNSIPRMINSSAHATKSAVIKQKSGAWIRQRFFLKTTI